MSKQDKSKKDGAKKKRKARAKDKAAGKKAAGAKAKAAAGQGGDGAKKMRKAKAAKRPEAPAATTGGRPFTAGRKTGSAAARASGDLRHRLIAELAYYLAEQRRAATADALEDWLQAEKAVDRLLDALA